MPPLQVNRDRATIGACVKNRRGTCRWQRQRERRADSWRAPDGQISAHLARELATDGKAKSNAFLRALRSRSHLDKGAENRVVLVRRDSAARVADRDRCLPFAALATHR